MLPTKISDDRNISLPNDPNKIIFKRKSKLQKKKLTQSMFIVILN